jgi:hypothetical protein
MTVVALAITMALQYPILLVTALLENDASITQCHTS